MWVAASNTIRTLLRIIHLCPLRFRNAAALRTVCPLGCKDTTVTNVPHSPQWGGPVLACVFLWVSVGRHYMGRNGGILRRSRRNQYGTVSS